jgi:MEDS: MEthanogen/methylotroph, DcmR Sensory domain
MAASNRKINLAGTVLNGSRHFCAFFHNKDEELRTLLPFILEGLAAGEKAIHFVNAETREEHRRRLIAAGIDVAAVEQSGQLEVVAWPDSHLLEGDEFNPERALEMIDHLLGAAREQGYRRTRGIGYMNWAFQNQIRAGALMAYEAKLNTILTRYDDPIICAYDLSLSSGVVVLDVMRTHPAALIGGVLQQNPFYIPPEQMLEELRARGEIGRDDGAR